MNKWIIVLFVISMAFAQDKNVKTFQVKYGNLIHKNELERLAPIKVSWTPYFLKGKKLVTYGYLEEMDIHLRDAVKHSEPLYRVSFEIPKPLSSTTGTVETLKNHVDLKYEIQGVRPLSSEEHKQFEGTNFLNWPDSSLMIWKAQQNIKDELNAKDKWFFCMWVRGHGVVSKHLQQDHGVFLSSLNCR